MAHHVRQQVRGAVKALIEGMASYNTNVHVMRPAERPLPDGTDAAWRIYMDDEPLEALSLDWPAVYSRRPLLQVEAVKVAGVAPVQDTLDDMSAAFEAAFGANPTLGGLLKASQLVRIETDIDADGARPVGVQRHSIEIEFHTLATAPESAL